MRSAESLEADREPIASWGGFFESPRPVRPWACGFLHMFDAPPRAQPKQTDAQIER